MRHERKMKVYEASGCTNQNTPTVILKGKWLREHGFEIGHKIKVICKKGTIIIMLEEKEVSEL